jgi:CDP-diacylglycerol--glycerol-3-phosphate 3-phosphatidyltransferase
MDDLDRWCALHAFERQRVGPVLATYLRAVHRTARRVPLSPNALTLLGLLVAVASVGAYARDLPLLAAPLVLASGLLDSLDGAVAAVRHRATTYGAVLDATADRLADLALLLGPALSVPAARPALVAAGAGTFLLEYVRARCQAAGLTAGQRVTPGERPTRVVAAALLALHPDWWRYGAWALAALTAVSAGLLLRDARARSTTAASA